MTASTIAEFFIEEQAASVELEIGVSDLQAFRNLMPDEIHERLGHEPAPLASRLPRFFAEDLVIGADGGETLPLGEGHRGTNVELSPDRAIGPPAYASVAVDLPVLPVVPVGVIVDPDVVGPVVLGDDDARQEHDRAECDQADPHCHSVVKRQIAATDWTPSVAVAYYGARAGRKGSLRARRMTHG
jgi:hypothetical protein